MPSATDTRPDLSEIDEALRHADATVKANLVLLGLWILTVGLAVFVVRLCAGI